MELLHRDLTDRIINVFYAVYDELGSGFLEKICQAAMVMAEVRSSDGSSGVVAYWLVPLSRRALPTLPATNAGLATVVKGLAGSAPVSAAVGPLASFIVQ